MMQKYGSIVLIDVLGTKNRWNKPDKQKMFDDWEQFLDLIENASKKIQEDLNRKPNPTIFKMNVHSFSDTILLTFTSDFVPKSDVDGQVMNGYASTNIAFACDIVATILVLGLTIDLPFRGCVSFGEFYESSRTVTGDAMIEAAEYYEQPDWIGVSLSNSACKILRHEYDQKILTKYDISLKKGIERNGLTINMLERFKIFHNQKEQLKNSNLNCIQLINKMNLSDDLSVILERMYVKNKDVSASLKIKNTIAFMNELKKIS